MVTVAVMMAAAGGSLISTGVSTNNVALWLAGLALVAVAFWIVRDA